MGCCGFGSPLCFWVVVGLAVNFVHVEGRISQELSTSKSSVKRENLSPCPNDCNDQGYCTTNSKCVCFVGFAGFDCREKLCPNGTAWADFATAVDTAHAMAPCSNMGDCDRTTGTCTCWSGFEGAACERMSCPNDCFGRGVCLSMREAALRTNVNNGSSVVLTRSVTYSQWDADKIHGCVCDAGFYGYDCSLKKCPQGDDITTTGQQDESHTVLCKCDGCDATSTFTITFKGETTSAIPHDADTGLVQYRLQELSGINGVTVAYSAGTAACSAGMTTITLTYTQDHGDLPAASVTSALTGGSNSLTMTSVQTLSCECTGTCAGSLYLTYDGERTDAIAFDATDAEVEAALELLSGISSTLAVTMSGAAMCAATAVTTSITFTGASGNVPTVEYISALSGTSVTVGITTTDGTKENLECSGRGTCNAYFGTCECFGFDTNEAAVGWQNYTSSNGVGGAGSRGDCGYKAYTPTHCPVKSLADPNTAVVSNYTCSGHGTCSGASNYACTCYEGWTGGRCAERTCPTGKAWFDEASATDTAHADGVECSSKGICDRDSGKCWCQLGWGGEACQYLECQGSTGMGPCDGNGVCKSMAELATKTMADGTVAAFTYGATPNNAATWDHDMIFGCACDSGFHHEPDVNLYINHHCSERPCPTGDDPRTIGGVAEVQTATCTGASGTFTFTFRSATTANIAYSATVDEVKDALEAISTINSVEVSFNTGIAACAGGGIAIQITFKYELGDLPSLIATTTSLNGGTGTVAIAETTQGTKENSYCSERGTCDHTTGICKCYRGFSSSDGFGLEGQRGDCGFVNYASQGTCTKLVC